MRIKSALESFKNDSVDTASPMKLVLMLFDRLCLDIARGKAAQASGKFVDAAKDLVHAQDILAALGEGLDSDWSQAKEVLAIYTFLEYELVAANLKKDQQKTQECLEIAETLRDMWQEVAAKAAAESTIPNQATA